MIGTGSYVNEPLIEVQLWLEGNGIVMEIVET